MNFERALQLDVGLEPFEPGQHPSWAVKRQPLSGRSAVATNPEQAVQIDAVIRMFVGDHYGVEVRVGDVSQQTRQGGVSEIEYDSEAVPVDQKAATRLARLGVGAGAPRTVSMRTQAASQFRRPPVTPGCDAADVQIPVRDPPCGTSVGAMHCK